jgi:NADH-quinone oxidoreductase subunit L
MINAIYVIAVPILPLAGFLLLGLFGKKYLQPAAGLISTILLAVSTLLSVWVAYQYFVVIGKSAGVYQQIIPLQFTWLQFSKGLSIDMGILLDPIAVMMIVVVSFVSLMVHIFSLWYMKGEERYATYFAFLSLFTFSMLGLVLSANIFQIYMFWELVGLSSFLLIGYYYNKSSAVAAAKKAFIVTRFADFGFLLGILILAFYSNTLDFRELITRLGNAQSLPSQSIHADSFMGLSAFTWALALVFAGGAGKSAMFPLHIWLPDAMEGPTPVSALIHAATMVVAGVYLVARLFPLFSLDETALTLVRYTGIISACIAAVIACTQTDIKRVLAFSTMSQIGYMMFALGLSPGNTGNTQGFDGAMFHLFTHAFFKSLLFLAAGAIIHLVHSNDLRQMGGLRKMMPVTHGCFLIACLAIAGVPPFAGFFSKEEILMAAYSSNKLIYYLALITGAVTAFYMFRLYFSIFWCKPTTITNHHGEGGWTMKIPLLVLAVLSILAGLPGAGSIHLIFSIAPVLLAAAGIFMAAILYKSQNEKPAELASSLGWFYKTAQQKFYIDELYVFVTKKFLFNLVGRPAAWFDKQIVDGAINGLASVTARFSAAIKKWQSGQVQGYTIYFFSGILAMGILFIYLWK